MSGWGQLPTDTEPAAWQPDTHTTADPFADDNNHNNNNKHHNADFTTTDPFANDGVAATDLTSKHDAPGASDRGCFNCGQEGHMKAECPQPRVVRPREAVTVFGPEVKNVSADEAWAKVEAADKAKDLDTFREALLEYAKACPEVTLLSVEQALRAAGGNIYLIALEQKIAETHTSVNFQGDIDQQYVVSYQYGYKPKRPKFAAGWPSSPEENDERLKTAGFVRDRGLSRCRNCDQLGHIAKYCTEEKIERERIEIICSNCKATGHRLRDCTEPRINYNACRNCKQEGHRAADCTEPRSAEGVECKVCNEMGHFAKDCPSKPVFACRNCGAEGHRASECTEERRLTCRNCDGEGHLARECPEPPNPAKMQCRNCDEYGHVSRACPKPRDYSRVTCSNCGEKGHTMVRCSQPAQTGTADYSGDAAPAFDSAPVEAAGDWNTGSGAGEVQGTGGR